MEDSSASMRRAALVLALASLGAVHGFVIPSAAQPAAALNMVATPPMRSLNIPAPHLEQPGAGRRKPTEDPFNPQFKNAADFGSAYPSSTKEYKEVRKLIWL